MTEATDTPAPPKPRRFRFLIEVLPAIIVCVIGSHLGGMVGMIVWLPLAIATTILASKIRDRSYTPAKTTLLLCLLFAIVGIVFVAVFVFAWPRLFATA